VTIDTEDYGAIVLRFKGGARGVLTVTQVTAGRKNCLRYEIAGAEKALAFNSETPNSLWIGERAEPNRELLRDPSLLDKEAAGSRATPGGHNEGFPDTFKQLYRAVYADVLNGSARRRRSTRRSRTATRRFCSARPSPPATASSGG
jgi:predicted dehydrogenase